MLIAGTGCGGFLDRWLCYLNSRMIIPGIDTLAIHAPAALKTLWESYCAEYKIPEGWTTTVYHFGFSEASDTIKSHAFRSENCFANEERPYGIGVKPECTVPENYNLPDAFHPMMNEQRFIQRQRPAEDRIYIGGEIIVHHLVKAGCSTFSMGLFEDFIDDVKAIYSRFGPDGPFA